MSHKNATQQDRQAKSLEMKKDNARKASLNEAEKEVYLKRGVSLGKAKAFVQGGNQGKGFWRNEQIANI